MKKKTGLITLLMSFFMVFTFAGCDLSSFFNPSKEKQIEKVYNQYVAYAQENGITPLSYEEWLETIKGESVEKIGIRAFTECQNLVTVDFPTLENIGEYAFSNSSIKEVNLPKVTDIGSNAFNGCNNLETAILPNAETVGIGAFRNCKSLKTVDLSSVTKISANAFRNSAIEIIQIDNVEEIGNYAFAGNANLISVFFPNLVSTGSYVFQNCPLLKYVYLPKLEDKYEEFDFVSCSRCW